jgi:hypothetical protein
LGKGLGLLLRGFKEVGEAVVSRGKCEATVRTGRLDFSTDLLVLQDLTIVASLCTPLAFKNHLLTIFQMLPTVLVLIHVSTLIALKLSFIDEMHHLSTH